MMLVLMWLVVFLFFWLAFSCITQWKPTRHIAFFHYILFFFSIYWGALDLYISRGSANQWFLFSVAIYPFLSLLGILAGKMVSPRVSLPDIQVRIEPPKVKFVLATFALFIGVYAVYLFTLGENIPFLVNLRETDSMLSHMARYTATKAYRETVFPVGFLLWFPRILIDYFGVFIIVFFYFHYSEKKTFNYIKFAAIAAIICLMGIMANEKYPVAKLVAISALCYFNVKYPRLTFHSIRYVLVSAMAFIFLVGLIYSLVTNSYRDIIGMGLAEALHFIIIRNGLGLLVKRGITGQCIPLYVIYEIIPDKYGFFMGRTFANPHHIFPYDPVALPYLIYASYNEAIQGLRGADPTIFFGEIYANFGILISLLSMFLFGVLLQVINGKLSNQIEKNRTAFLVAFFYLWMTYLGDFAIGFSVPWFDERIWFFIGIYVLGKYI
jgi:hypothetical protein